eukprot:scaffold12505_cov163-Isochrysis_galbana.AAC.1
MDRDTAHTILSHSRSSRSRRSHTLADMTSQPLVPALLTEFFGNLAFKGLVTSVGLVATGLECADGPEGCSPTTPYWATLIAVFFLIPKLGFATGGHFNASVSMSAAAAGKLPWSLRGRRLGDEPHPPSGARAVPRPRARTELVSGTSAGGAAGDGLWLPEHAHRSLGRRIRSAQGLGGVFARDSTNPRLGRVHGPDRCPCGRLLCARLRPVARGILAALAIRRRARRPCPSLHLQPLRCGGGQEEEGELSVQGMPIQPVAGGTGSSCAGRRPLPSLVCIRLAGCRDAALCAVL